MSFASSTHKARLSLCPCIASSGVLVFQHATSCRTPPGKGRRRSLARHCKEPETASPATWSQKTKDMRACRSSLCWGGGVKGLAFCARTNSGIARKGSLAVTVVVSVCVRCHSTHSLIDVSALGFHASSAWTSLALVCSLEGEPNWFPCFCLNKIFKS